MMLRRRTESEMKAYVEGYQACLKAYNGYLNKCTNGEEIRAAQDNMLVIFAAVQAAGLTEDGNEERLVTGKGCSNCGGRELCNNVLEEDCLLHSHKHWEEERNG